MAADAEFLVFRTLPWLLASQGGSPLEEARCRGAGHVRQGQHVGLEAQGQGDLLFHRRGVGLVYLGAVGGEPALLHCDALIRVHLGEAARHRAHPAPWHPGPRIEGLG